MATALAGGLAAGCGGAGGNPSGNLPKLPDTSQRAQRALDYANWRTGAGGQAFAKLSRDLGSQPGDPASWPLAKYTLVERDIKDAMFKPLPKSVDPDQHYADFMGYYGQAIRDAANGNNYGEGEMIVGELTAAKELKADLAREGLATLNVG